MRKKLFFLTLVAAAVCGCAKCHDAELDPSFSPIAPEVEKISFQATVDGPYVTKVTVPTSDFYTVWDEGDEMLVVGEGKQAVYKASVGKDVWTTLKYKSGDALSLAETNKAYYPSSFYSEGLPAKYNYEDVSSEKLHHLPMVAYSDPGENTLAFKYMCGIAHFSYTNSSEETLTLEKMVITSKNPLSGKGTIVMGEIPAYILEGNGDLTIEFGQQGKVLKPGDPMDIYIPLPAADYKKIIVNLHPVGGGDPVAVRYSGKASIARSEVSLLNLNFVPGPDDPIDGEDLSVNGTANCYVATKAASYKFPAVKGNSPATDLIPDIASASVLWESFNDYSAPEPEDFISNCEYTRGWIVFDLNAGCYGNAVIAARDASDNILWSWHIWIPETEIGVETQGGFTIQDRHLGAPCATQLKTSDDALRLKYTPLLYQWGRKDPFPGTGISSSSSKRNFILASAFFTSTSLIPNAAGPVSIDTSIKNPTTFYTDATDWCDAPASQRWSSTKTIYDPCPAGYRVPDMALWNALNGAAWTNASGTFNDGTYAWPNVLTIVGSSGAKGSGNTAVYWSTSLDEAGNTKYGSPVASKFNFLVTTTSKYPRSTGATVRCIAE